MELQKKWVAQHLSPYKNRDQWSDNYIVAKAIFRIAVQLRDTYHTESVHTEDDIRLLDRIPVPTGHIGTKCLEKMADLIDRLIDYQNQKWSGLAECKPHPELGDYGVRRHNHRLGGIKKNAHILTQWKEFVEDVADKQLSVEDGFPWSHAFGESTIDNWIEVTNNLPLLTRDTLKGV